MRPIALWLALWLVTQTSPMLPRPEILRIACVRVQTADLARARRFYAGVLGLSALRWDPRAGVAAVYIHPPSPVCFPTLRPVGEPAAFARGVCANARPR